MSGENSRRLRNARTQQNSLLSQIAEYSVTIASVALALGITLALNPYLAPTPTPLFFAAIMLSAWYGGLGPGIAATVLSTLAINYFLVEPIYELSIPDLGTFVRLGTFVMTALFINSLTEAQRTARRKAEVNFKSLQESEARFGCLAGSNIIGTLVAEIDGTILDANQNFLQLVGYSQEELRTGRLNWRMITPPESLEVSERAVEQLLTAGACTPFEKEYLRKDGSLVPVLHGAVMTGEATVTGFVLDLSEHKRVTAIQQEAVRRERSLFAEVQVANAQLETVLASIDDQFLVLDQQWRYVYVSDRVVEVVGRSREELMGRCIWDIFPDIVGSQFYTEVHRAAAEQRIIQFEYFYTSWQRWFENRIYPSSTGVSVLVTDITERKQAEEELQRTNRTLQTLLDFCPVAISFFDPQGVVKLWNRAAERIFGWSAEETIGKFMPTVPHRQAEFLLSLQTVLSGQSLDGFGAQHQRKDGQKVDLEIWANLTHDAEGNPGCLGIALDITDRKQAEAALRHSEDRFQVLVSNLPGMVYRYAPGADKATFTYISSGSRALIELEPETILQNANAFLELIHPDDKWSFQNSVAVAVQNSTNWLWEGRLITPSGQHKWVQGRSRPQYTEQGEVWDGLFFDITDRKRAEAERVQLLEQEREAREQAEAANRIKDEFLAVLSHELRTPLNPILGWSRLLRQGILDTRKTTAALETIERNAKLQTQLIDDLLDISRILQGKLSLKSVPVDLNTTITAAIETVQLAVEAKGIHIQTQFECEGVTVLGDGGRLQQVVWNLLTNAVKFTPETGQIQIRLSTTQSRAQIQVTDTGRGIRSEFLPYVFDTFRQADSTTTRTFGGLGLGLAIVRHLVELHGGTVQAESPGEGQGATFTVTLPLMPALPSIPQEAAPISDPFNLQGVDILVIDDEVDNLELVQFILEQAGATVLSTSLATEALNKIPQLKPQLIVADIGMPGMDGYALMQRVRKLPPEEGGQIPAIALTAYAGEVNQQQALAAGFQRHLSKPVDPEAFMQAIAELLHQT
ncbi:PAS domain S-box protein [Cyanobacteria bacterium FACHB-63]|nr:PAS domain S-box protein [Cyanobacteria bacterium FACHB-63]